MLLRVVVDDGGGHRPLSVEIDEAGTNAALLAAIAPKIDRAGTDFGLRVRRSGRLIIGDELLAETELRSGDILEVLGVGAEPGTLEGKWMLRAVAGPAEGAEVDLGPGRTLLGRIVEPGGVALSDPRISRRHAVVEISDGTMILQDAGSSNGTEVNGAPIGTDPVRVGPGDRIGIGSTVFEVASLEPERLGSHLTYEAGALAFNRPPRPMPRPPGAQYAVPRPPQEPPKRRLSIATILMPLALSAAMFATSRNAIFLLITLLTPILALLSQLEDRRSGRHEFRDQAERFRETIAEIAEKAAAVSADGRSWRRDSSPPPGALLGRIGSLAPTLWQRRSRHADFGQVAVGRVDSASTVQVTASDGGSEELTREALEALEEFTFDEQAPAVISLREAGVVGVVGDRDQLDATARWLALQAATHHSPRETAIAVLTSNKSVWDWAMWLPHVGILERDQISIASDDERVRAVFDAVRNLVSKRTAANSDLIGAGPQVHLPHYVVFVDPPVRLSPAEFAAVLDSVGSAGVTVVWLSEDEAALPGACSTVVDLTAGSIRSESGTRAGITIDSIGADEAYRAALALAPLRDTTQDQSSQIPAMVDLMSLLDPMPETAEVVADRWASTYGGIPAVLGVSADGTFEVDIATDGPHGLLGGTTGAGKSELLQTLIASIAVTHSPRRVNFVLVDYKGGAAFKDCVGLPHTVGFVTDLDGRLAHRAIESLNAELRWREHRLAEADAKDLADMRKKSPEGAPPNLIIVVDEFAALASEVPAFIDGVVDIARRGRSLGVHLLLATQKPRGVITSDIQANTNLRMALRVTDTDESHDIIERPDAALLSRRQAGRAFVKTGPREVTEVQVAYVGGAPPSGAAPEAAAHTFKLTPAMIEAVSDDAGGVTQLQALVSVAVEAATLADIPDQRRPWLPALPDLIAFAPPAGPDLPVPSVAVGTLDAPGSQTQPPYVLDLESAGSIAIHGTVGTGKTTALRTAAAVLASTFTVDEVHLYAVDFTGMTLATLTKLPHCGDVVLEGEDDRARRLITMLDTEVGRRRTILGESGSASLAEYRAYGGDTLPAIVVLIDGFPQLWASVDSFATSQIADTLERLISEGRGVGLHFVITADRRGSLPSSVARSMTEHVLLRLADADDYLGLPGGAPIGFEKAPPGRCWSEQGEAQFAVLTSDGDATGTVQGRMLEELAVGLASPADVGPEPVRLLPERVEASDLPTSESGSFTIPIGLDEDHVAPIGVDLSKRPTLLVAGPSGSGRTTTLDLLAEGYLAAHPGAASLLIGSRRSQLFAAPWWSRRARSDEAADVSAWLRALIADVEANEGADPVLVVVDDADELSDSRIMDEAVRASRDGSVVLLASTTNYGALQGFDPWIQAMRQSRSGVLLQPAEDDDEIFFLRMPGRPAAKHPPGRGMLVSGGDAVMVQVGHPEERNTGVTEDIYEKESTVVDEPDSQQAAEEPIEGTGHGDDTDLGDIDIEGEIPVEEDDWEDEWADKDWSVDEWDDAPTP